MAGLYDSLFGMSAPAISQQPQPSPYTGDGSVPGVVYAPQRSAEDTKLAEDWSQHRMRGGAAPPPPQSLPIKTMLPFLMQLMRERGIR